MPALRSPLVYLTVLVVATCGLVYELVAGTLASYVLGDSVTQFSTVIGVYLSALGLGSYASWRSSWRWPCSEAPPLPFSSSPSGTSPISSAWCST